MIRLWDCEKWEQHPKRMQGGHSKPITKLYAYEVRVSSLFVPCHDHCR